MNTRRRFLLAIAVSTMVLSLLWALSPLLLGALPRWLDVGRRPQPADYVMVLNGEENSRPFAAAALLEAGFARHALVTEVAPTPPTMDLIVPPMHQINSEVLQKRGVGSDRITLFPAAAATTYDEARALADFLRDRPEARVLIVTNDYHTRRSHWVFARVLGKRAEQVVFVSAPTDELRSERWWQNEKAFATVATEYLKLVFYVGLYGHVGYWLLAFSGLLIVAQWIRRRGSCAAG